jgi:phosphohistidine phosphatase SixA
MLGGHPCADGQDALPTPPCEVQLGGPYSPGSRPSASFPRASCVELIADHLGRQRIKPTLVLCSASARTRETLEQVGAVLSDEIDVRIEERLYTASASGLLDRLQEVDARVDSVMLIGHEPAIRGLALMLADNGADLERLREKFPDRGVGLAGISGQLQRTHAWSRQARRLRQAEGA